MYEAKAGNDTFEKEFKLPRGFFRSGFPFHVGDFCAIHPFTVIPTASGEASAAAAQPRFGAEEGAAASRSLRGFGRGYEYGGGPPAMGMRTTVPRSVSSRYKEA